MRRAAKRPSRFKGVPNCKLGVPNGQVGVSIGQVGFLSGQVGIQNGKIWNKNGKVWTTIAKFGSLSDKSSDFPMCVTKKYQIPNIYLFLGLRYIIDLYYVYALIL